ncbi:MAG: TonB-dependent receptor [Gammaproteobacteria bacterium]
MKFFSSIVVLVLSHSVAFAEADSDLITIFDEMVVEGHQSKLIGDSISASEGVISAKEIALRPILRTGEVLEFVPGMVVTQHSGSGKANQYFLRGYNLDHGTDFRTVVDGMPVNMRSHGHGQGYSDLNFIVPEFVEHIAYQKGPYHAENGDFSTAGSASFHLTDKIKQPFAKVEVGKDQFFRTVLAGTVESDLGNLSLGLETHQYNGPWKDIEEDVEKFNAMARLVSPVNAGELSLTFLAYENDWNSADQIPQRAIDQGRINRLGSLDEQVGGDASRYSISTQWHGKEWSMNAYAIRSKLDLFSNFTYFLDDPVNGDQFEQVDSRTIYGASIQRQIISHIDDRHLRQNYGLQLQFDDIDDVALYRTANLNRLSTVRQDQVKEYSVAAFWEGELELIQDWYAMIGVRYDYLAIDVDSDFAANGGDANDGLLSFKSGLSYQFNEDIEFYANFGQSFHSNDARGATITVDPVTGDPADSVDLLVRGKGGEIGFRYHDDEKFNLSAALWVLELDSELLFVGDAGNTEASRPSRRSGVEIAAYYWFDNHFGVDLELSWSHSQFY